MSTVIIARPSMENLRHPSIYLKIPEIILLICAMVPFFLNGNTYPVYAAIVLVSGFINAILFVTLYGLGYTQLRHIPLEIVLYAHNALALFICSIILMTAILPRLVAAGVFCLFLSFVYTIEVYFSFTTLTKTPPLPHTFATTSHHMQQQQQQEQQQQQYPAVIIPASYTNDLDFTPVPLTPTIPNTNPVYPTTMNYPPHPVPEFIESPQHSYYGPTP